jgi:hypothetical protein
MQGTDATIQNIRSAIRAKAEASESEAAELAKNGRWLEAAAKYGDGEEGRAAYDKLSNNTVFNNIVAMYPSLSALPREPEELGIAPEFELGAEVEPRGYNGVLSIVDMRRALVLMAMHQESEILRTYIHNTHTLLSDATDLGSGIAAIPRWAVSVMQEVGVVDGWKQVIGHHARVYATINHRRACELLSVDGLGTLEAKCAETFAKLRAIHDDRVAKARARKDERNRKIRDRRTAKTSATAVMG